MSTDTSVLNEKDLALIRAKNFGHVSTTRRDGSPHAVAVWIDERDGRAWFNSSDRSAHVRHLKRDPRVALSVHDQENPYLAVTLLGTAALKTDGADEDVDALTRKYTDMDRFPDDWRDPSATRVTVEIVPSTVLRYGY